MSVLMSSNNHFKNHPDLTNIFHVRSRSDPATSLTSASQPQCIRQAKHESNSSKHVKSTSSCPASVANFSIPNSIDQRAHSRKGKRRFSELHHTDSPLSSKRKLEPSEVNQSRKRVSLPPATPLFESKVENESMSSVPAVARILANLKPALASSNSIRNSSLLYPDTAYSYINYTTSSCHNFEVIQNTSNNEWRANMVSNLKSGNLQGFKRYKDYCLENYKVTDDKVGGNLRTDYEKSRNIPRTRNKMVRFIEAQLRDKESGSQAGIYNTANIINYPFVSNYTYQKDGYLDDVSMLCNNVELYKNLDASHDDKKSEVRHEKHPDGGKLQLHQTINTPVNEPLSIPASHMVTPPLSSKSSALTHSEDVKSTQPKMSTFKYVSPNSSPMKSSSCSDQVTVFRAAKSPQSPKKSPKSPSSRLATISHPNRVCISCHSNHSPCWRPSWSALEGQLCNSCGLRYKKTGARCTNRSCLRIPAKGEWTLMKNKGKLAIPIYGNNEHGEFTVLGEELKYKCLHCEGTVEVGESER
ncbi:BA75_00445T0 [Komagataella pastoris]|uniref:BA75_00445T0 n=1 Tax=Komagataella pastoris TaxID=4922 RepID=A0A1B2J8M7_PICPA|nr:BA75_00445T0 [Komagataella pastoris]